MHHPFGTFPKTHLIWYSHPSLNKTVSFFCDGGCCWWTSRWRRRRISRTSSSESESRLARPPPSPSHFTGETAGSQVISNQLWDKLASPLTRGHKKSKQTFMKRQCKGFRISLRGRAKYFVLKIIKILHIHFTPPETGDFGSPCWFPVSAIADFSRVSCSWDQNHIIEGIHLCTMHLDCSKLQK